MTSIGITGQQGFIGKHLHNTLALYPDEFARVNYERQFFDDEQLLDEFVSSCDVIIHLAAMNRHHDPARIYETNMMLTSRLIESLMRTKSKAHVLFASSTQETRDSPYGLSKKTGRQLLKQWAAEANAIFTGMVIPNVFGPFGHPYHNSVVATFCHQLSHNEVPRIDVDGEIKLLYVAGLVNEMIRAIRNKHGNPELNIPHTHQIKVSDLLGLLTRFKTDYQEKGMIPLINSRFELDLFNTFRCYMPLQDHFPVKFAQHQDARGAFVEIIRLNGGGQVSFSTTKPGITRGNHFHTRKIERFAVIRGKALIQLRQIGSEQVLNFYLSGDEPACVDMPIWFTHNIKNIGEEDLYTIFWINEFFDPADADTFFATV